ncbi:MAG: hypothetical protein GF320_00960 [Armatimonadia bacterium]|nr:hypothetical protein [Armatimonadia bacterium]
MSSHAARPHVLIALISVVWPVPVGAAELRVGPEADFSAIQAAVDAAEPGDVVLLAPGTYREEVRVDGPGGAGITLRADGDLGQAILSGADIISDWEPAPDVGPGVYRHGPWEHVWIGWTEDMSHGAPPPVGRSEQVIWNGRLLTHVLTKDELAPGTFLADPKDDKALYVRLPQDASPSDGIIEASVRTAPLAITGEGVTVEGLVVRHAANMAQHGAISVEGSGHTIRGSVVEWTNGNGLSFRGDHITLDSVISRYNGQIGMGGGGEDCLLTDCALLHNNQKGFSSGWEAGGIKITHALRVDVIGTLAMGNGGTGIWYDIDNRECEIAGCVAVDNRDSGIFVEISGLGGFDIHHNLCVNNGLGGDWASGGICLGESTDCDVRYNLCVANPTGISIREQGPRELEGRGGERLSYRNERHHIHHNLMAGNARAQFGLWWDNVHFGPHPSPDVSMAGTPLDPLAAGIQVHDNLYMSPPGVPPVAWGVGWREKSQVFADLAAFTEATALGEGARSIELSELAQALQALGLGDLSVVARQALAEHGALGPPSLPGPDTD